MSVKEVREYLKHNQTIIFPYLENAVKTMVPPLQKAIDMAAEAPRSGQMIEMVDSEKLKMLKPRPGREKAPLPDPL